MAATAHLLSPDRRMLDGLGSPVSDERSLHQEVRSAWDRLAGFWDDRMQAGETWQGNLIHPTVERLLALRPRERVLEIACGTGDFARRMAEVGALVLAVDFSEGMLERARAHGGDVDYAYADATQEQELLKLGDEDRSMRSLATWRSWTWSPSSRWSRRHRGC